MFDNQVEICNVKVHNYSFDEIVEAIIKEAKQTNLTPKYVVTPNVRHIVLLQDDPLFMQIYADAWLAVPDGVPLIWVSKLMGTPLKERVNGTDLFERICEKCAQEGVKVYFLGGRPGAAEKAGAVLQTKHPGLDVVGINCPPFGFEKDLNLVKQINQNISEAQPQILFVGLGAPKQEKWIYAHQKKIGIPVCIGIGVSFEFVAGVVKRAPPWMQKIGLEWFYRLISEPERLWKRYAVENTRFVLLVMQQFINKYRAKTS